MLPIAIYTHSDCLFHDTGPYHPENRGRITAICKALQSAEFSEHLSWLEAPLATEEDLLLAHSASYIQAIWRSLPTGERVYIDADTVMSPGTWDAALRAAGAGVSAVNEVLSGNYNSVFCATRPPGHHATSDEAMGFCIFNNIAIAAFHALELHGLKRVAIVDFDVHHGNGTEAIVKGDNRIFYVSTHQSPLWPGTGRALGKEENILNLPLPPGTDGENYRAIFLHHIRPSLLAFKPELLLVSAGFDGHKDDPLAGFSLLEEDYHWIGKELCRIAGETCGGKVISLLEGGYHHQALAVSVCDYVKAFL